jgi:hypothetical protein
LGCTSAEDIDGACPEVVSGGHVVAHEPVHAIVPPFSGLNVYRVRPLWFVRIVPRPETLRVDTPGETCELGDVDAAGAELVVVELLLPHAAASTASGTNSKARDRKASLLEIKARGGH